MTKIAVNEVTNSRKLVLLEPIFLFTKVIGKLLITSLFFIAKAIVSLRLMYPENMKFLDEYLLINCLL